MKARECEVGDHVRDVRTGHAYRVVEKRVLASDPGAYCAPLEEGQGGGLIYWSDLEPLESRDGVESHG